MDNEEYLDIVDENNELTGEIQPRSLAHSTGLWHRTVHIYIFRLVENEMEILVHLRAKNKDLNPGRWDTRFGGHIKAGEKIKEATVGEVKDEVGLDINQEDLIEGELIKRNKYPNNEFTQAYYLKFDGDVGDLEFNDGEVQEVKWMSVSDIEKALENESDDWIPRPNEWATKLENFKRVVKFLENRLL